LDRLTSAFSRPGESFQHEPNHGELDHTFAPARYILIIFAHTAIAAYPCQCSLHDPPAREMPKAFRTLEDLSHLLRDPHPRPDPHPTWSRGMAHHFDFPSYLLLNPLPSFPCLRRIDPHFFQAGKDPFDRLQEQIYTLTGLKAGYMDDDFDEQSHRIDEDLSLSA
jgi:hypothetical protein